tara:strand:- start:16924 stop:18000 length:1077 start_codon:yes stop_codon:yes gene_type:complete
MPESITQQTNVQSPRNVVMVIYPQVHILDVAGPIEILTGSSLFLETENSPYQVSLVAEQAGPVMTTSGLTLQADQAFADAMRSRKPIDTLIVAGGHGTTSALGSQSLLHYVRTAAGRARRIVSICTGAMILAELGLLDGRRATTHWFWCPVLKRQYPQITVEPDALFVRDGNVWTSAGVTAGMDLCLALIEQDWGHDIALQIARYNVMYMMRPGGQAQFSAQLIGQLEDQSPIADTIRFIQNNLDGSLSISTLADNACMSERTFARKFKDAMQLTPAQYVERARLEAARAQLEQASKSVALIAWDVGFENAERMRRAFQRHLGISPSEYRERFQATPYQTSRSEKSRHRGALHMKQSE